MKVPLSAIYLLDRVEEAEGLVCEPMPQAEAVMALTSQSFRIGLRRRRELMGGEGD